MSDDEFDFEAELAAMQQEEFEAEKRKKEEERQQAEKDAAEAEPGPDGEAAAEPPPADEEPPAAAEYSSPPSPPQPSAEDPPPPRVVSAVATAPRLTSRPGTTASGRASAKVHPVSAPVMAPLQALPERDPERGPPEPEEAQQEQPGSELEPEWAKKWLSGPNKRAKLHAFQQYIQRVEDLGEGPVDCPTAEQRHATPYWLSARYCDNTTLHGLKNVWAAGSRKRRFLWILCMLLAFTGFGYQVYGTLAEYLEYPKKVTIELLEDREPIFPSVTICNFNILSLEKMRLDQKYKEIADLEDEYLDNRIDCDSYSVIFADYYSVNDKVSANEGGWWDASTHMSADIGELPEFFGSGDTEEAADTTAGETTSGAAGTEETEAAAAGGDSAAGGTTAPDTVDPTFYDVSTIAGETTTELPATTETDNGVVTVNTDTETDTGSDSTETATETATAAAGSGAVGSRRKRGISDSASAMNETSPATVPDEEESTTTAGVVTSRPPRPASPVKGRLRRRMVMAPTTSAHWAKLKHPSLPIVVRDRRSAEGTEQNGTGLSVTSPPSPTAGPNGTFPGFGGNYTYFDSVCQCMLRCTALGCYEYNSVFDLNGGNRTFTNLVDAFAQSTSTDVSMLSRAFTPSVDEMKTHGIKSAQFINTCSFDGVRCSHTAFERWQSDGYGNCFTFNSGFRYSKDNKGKWKYMAPNKTRSYGSQSGLRVTLNVDPTRYASLLTPDVGVRVLVHAPSQLPFPEEGGFSVLPGFTTIVGVRNKKIKRVSEPHGTCRSSEYWTDAHARYTPTACRKRCTEQAIRRTCNCSESVNKALTFGLQTGLLRCNPLDSIKDDRCRQQVKSKFTLGETQCDCPPACEEDRYEQMLSMSLPNKNYYRILYNLTEEYVGADICDSEEISNNTIRLQVFLEDLSHEQITESPAYSLEALISNIGGLLGLFIGMSAITVLEAVEFLLDLVAASCRNCGRKDAAMRKSGIQRVEVLPPESNDGMKYVRVVHKFEVPRETIITEWPEPTLVDRECSTMVSVPVNQADNKAWMRTK